MIISPKQSFNRSAKIQLFSFDGPAWRPVNFTFSEHAVRKIIAFAIFMVNGSCALADNVVAELSRRTLISVPELHELLSDCEKTQLAMNICAARNSVAADMKMKQMFNEALLELNDSCRPALEKAQARWKKRVSSNCDKEANAEAEGGSMRPMAYNSCVEAETLRHTKQLATMKSCKNVREPIIQRRLAR